MCFSLFERGKKNGDRERRGVWKSIRLIGFSYVSVPRDWCFGFFTWEFQVNSKGKGGKRIQGREKGVV